MHSFNLLNTQLLTVSRLKIEEVPADALVEQYSWRGEVVRILRKCDTAAIPIVVFQEKQCLATLQEQCRMVRLRVHFCEFCLRMCLITLLNEYQGVYSTLQNSASKR